MIAVLIVNLFVAHAKMTSNIVLLISIMSVNAKFTTIYYTDSPLERIGPRLYRKELLTNKFQSPRELAYDSSSRNLYFMYMDDVLQNSGRAYINVMTKQAMKINGIQRNRATAVDAGSGEVYFGSENGLYKYDPINNVAKNIGLYNINVSKIVIRNNEMYIIDANDHMVYKIFNEGRTAVKVGDLKTVMQFDVDNEKNVHLVTMCGVYCAFGGHEVVKNQDLNVVYHFMVEEDKTYGLSDDGIYDIDCLNGTAKRVAETDFFPSSFILGDYGDIFYSIDDDIYRLKPVHSYVIYNVYRKKHK